MPDRISPTAEHILEALGRYQFLTTSQLLRLGVTGDKSHLYDTLRTLKRGRPPAIIEIPFGAIPGIGRLASIYALTKLGAQLIEERDRGLSSLPLHRRVRVFTNDYFHRVGCVDFAITVHEWAGNHGYQVDLFHTYYDPVTHGRAGRRARLQTAITLSNGALVPDCIFSLTSPDGVRRLFAYELYRKKRTERVLRQLEAYLAAIDEDAIQKAYQFTKAVRILCVFDDQSALDLVRKRMSVLPGFAARDRWFFLAPEATTNTDFIGAWQRVSGEGVRLF